MTYNGFLERLRRPGSRDLVDAIRRFMGSVLGPFGDGAPPGGTASTATAAGDEGADNTDAAAAAEAAVAAADVDYEFRGLRPHAPVCG